MDNNYSGLSIKLSGLVQGVNLRRFVVELAGRYDLVGWVKNQPEGMVEILAEGPKDKLKAFLVDLTAGHGPGRIEAIDYRYVLPTDRFEQFSINYDR